MLSILPDSGEVFFVRRFALPNAVGIAPLCSVGPVRRLFGGDRAFWAAQGNCVRLPIYVGAPPTKNSPLWSGPIPWAALHFLRLFERLPRFILIFGSRVLGLLRVECPPFSQHGPVASSAHPWRRLDYAPLDRTRGERVKAVPTGTRSPQLESW